MMDLAVAYRIYPGVSKVPAYYSSDKFKLSEMCLASFQEALGDLKVKVYAILDGCPPEYVDLFQRVLQGRDLEIIQPDRIGNHATFGLQIDLLRNQTSAEYVYFAEDDYFYFPEAIKRMVGFIRDSDEVDFVTPYDHPDSYYTSSCHERHFIKPWGDRYWRTTSSTCLTFLTSRHVLESTQSILRSYCRGNMDCPMWQAMTQKFSLFDPRIHFADILRLKLWVRTWQYGFGRVMFGRRYKLWAPIPTLSTHMESTCLSPLVDWQEEFHRFELTSGQSS